MKRRIRSLIMTTRMRSLVTILYTILFSPVVTADHGPVIYVVTSSGSQYQQDISSQLQKHLASSHFRSEVLTNGAEPSVTPGEISMYVAIGTQAIEAVSSLDRAVPVLKLVSNVSDMQKHSSVHASLLLAQPACRYFALIRAINPEWKRVGVLASREALDEMAELTRCAIRANMNMNLYPVADKSDLLESLEQATEENHVLLALPDASIYNPQTVKNILLTSYRNRTPLIGYSENFVHAGAVAAVFTSADSAGVQAAKIIAGFFAGRHGFDRETYFPEDFTVTTNRQVGRALNLALPDEDELRKVIKEVERRNE